MIILKGFRNFAQLHFYVMQKSLAVLRHPEKFFLTFRKMFEGRDKGGLQAISNSVNRNS